MQYLVKIDLSGIQSFIFDVPSDGAARELKGRSFYIYALSKICRYYLDDVLGVTGKVLYEGGGNAFIYYEIDEHSLGPTILNLQKAFSQDQVCPVIAYTEVVGDFQDQMRRLNHEVQKAKYQRPIEFEPFDPAKSDGWKAFTKGLSLATGYTMDTSQTDEFSIDEKGISKAGIRFLLSHSDSSFKNSVVNKLPLNEKHEIPDFDGIAPKSEGVEKIAGLKLDVDNLGCLFAGRSKKGYEKLSKEMNDFFESTLFQLLQESIDNGKIYPVFAGGDDCFLIGAWSEIFRVAGEIQKEFDRFQQKLRQQVTEIQDRPITLSAGIIVVSSKYPMIRLAEETEKVLEMAKEQEGKNRITVFNIALSWQEFELARDIALKLRDLIEHHGESKSILSRITNSDLGYKSVQKHAINGRLNFPKIWRLKYYLKNVQEENRDFVENEIFKKYEKALINDCMNEENGDYTNPQIFPIAARWAELLLRDEKAYTTEFK